MSKFKWLLLSLAVTMAANARSEDLLEVYQQALEADPELKSAELKVEVGAAQKGQALGQMLPQISGNANWSKNKQSRGNVDSKYTGTRYYVSLNQSLLDFAKFWTWRRAQEVEDQYDLEHIEAQHTLMLNVVERYFGVLEAEDQLHYIETENQATQQQLKQVRKQFAKQLIKITDVYEVEAHLDKINADQIEAETILVTAQESLRELTNNMPAHLNTLSDGIEYKELEGELDDWIAVAKSENPTMAAQQRAIDAASDDVAVQKSKYLPVVDLQLNFYDTNTGFQSQNLGSDVQTQVGAINVNVPIFTGGTTTHRLFEAQSRLEITKQGHESKLRALVKETSNAFLLSNANVRRIKATRKALESAAKSREAMETGYKYGVETISEVLDAQQAEFKAKKDLSQIKYNYIKNRIRFMRAIGTISEENLKEINGWLETPSQS